MKQFYALSFVVFAYMVPYGLFVRQLAVRAVRQHLESHPEARDEFEKQYILARLREFAWNMSRTAEALGVERSNLYRKLHTYGIRVERP